MGLDYPKEWTELNRKCQVYETAAESNLEWATNQSENEKNRDHMKGYHWVNKRSGDKNRERPSIQLTLQQGQMQMAKIFQGHGFKPEVVAESDKVYTDDAIRLAIRKNEKNLQSRTEAEAAAELRTIILDYYYEKLDMLGVFKEACQMAQWYEGGAYIVDTYDQDGPHLHVVHPSDIRYDPEATCIEDVRFICYYTRRTLAYIKKNYPTFADDVQPDGKKRRQGLSTSRHTSIGLDEDVENVTLECWYIRDYEMIPSRADEQDVIEPERLSKLLENDYIIDESKTEYAPMQVDGITGPIIEEVPVKWTVYRESEEYKYPGGWKKVYRANQIVLNDPTDDESFHIHSANGELPIHHLKYYNVPGEFEGMSLVRQIKPLTQIVDRLTQEGLDTIQTLSPFIAMLQGRTNFDATQRMGSDFPIRVVKFNAEAGVEDIREVFQHHQGAELTQSFWMMLDKLRNLIEDIGGGYDLRSANNLPQDASGKFVEAVETAGNARISEIRENVRNCMKSVASNILANVLYYETNEHSFRATRGAKTAYINVVPAELTNDDAEADFDILVGGSNTLPNDPIMRNEHNMEIITRLTALPDKLLALGILDNMEMDNRESIRQVVEQFYDNMAEKSKQSGQDPEVSKRYQEGASDVLEQLGKQAAEFNPEMSLAISLELQKAAGGNPIDYKGLDAMIQRKRQQITPTPQGAIQ